MNQNPFQAPTVLKPAGVPENIRKAENWRQIVQINTICAALFLMICMIADVTVGLPVLYSFLLLGMSIPLALSIVMWQYHYRK